MMDFCCFAHMVSDMDNDLINLCDIKVCSTASHYPLPFLQRYYWLEAKHSG